MIIGIAGRKTHGKDTAAMALYPLGFQSIKLADPLKAMLGKMYEMAGYSAEETYRKLNGDLKEVPCDLLGGQTPRWAMQSLGTEWRKLICDDLWVRIWTQRVVDLVANGYDVVCTDIRHDFEVEAVRKMGGKIIRVRRDVIDDGDSHSSEIEIDHLVVDFEIENTGTIEELHRKVRSIL